VLRLIASHQVTANFNIGNVVYIYPYSSSCVFSPLILLQSVEPSAAIATMDEQPYPRELSMRPFTLVLVSHSHSPPLSPTPDLKLDLRKVSNPPKHTRDACDGRSKHLREHLLATDDFCALLETAQMSIEGKMMGFTKNRSEDLGERSRARFTYHVYSSRLVSTTC
jgi:hypothetical protein